MPFNCAKSLSSDARRSKAPWLCGPADLRLGTALEGEGGWGRSLLDEAQGWKGEEHAGHEGQTEVAGGYRIWKTVGCLYRRPVVKFEKVIRLSY